MWRSPIWETNIAKLTYAAFSHYLALPGAQVCFIRHWINYQKQFNLTQQIKPKTLSPMPSIALVPQQGQGMEKAGQVRSCHVSLAIMVHMCNILAIISQIGDLQIEKIILDFFWVVPHLCLSIYLLLVYKLSTITNTSIMSSPSDLSASLLPLLPLRATSGPSSRSKVHEQTKSCSLEREFCLKLKSKLISCLKG